VTARERAAPTGVVRVGLLLPSLEVPAWVWTAIRDVAASSDAEVVVAAVVAGPDGKRPGRGRRGAGAFRGTLHRIDALLELCRHCLVMHPGVYSRTNRTVAQSMETA